MGVSIFSNTLLDLVGLVPVDTKITETHKPTATPSNFALENGAVVTDHVILNPLILEMEFILSNRDIPFGSVPASYGIRAALLYTLLFKQLQTRKLYTVLTRHRLYTDMCLIELPAEHAAPFTGMLTCRAKFQQIKKAKAAGVTVTQGQLAEGVDLQASSPTNFGLIQTIEPVNSSFFDVFLESVGI